MAKSHGADQGAKDAAALVLAALAAPPHTEQVAASGGAAALIAVVAGTSRPELTLSAARQRGQSAPIGSAPARPLCLLSARLAALGQLGTPRVRPSHWAPSHGLRCSS